VSQLTLAQGAGGLLVLAFSGHGVSRSDNPLLLTYESVLNDSSAIDDLSLPVSKLKGFLETGSASQIILLIDACQDDPDPGHPFSPGNLLTREFVDALTLRSTKTLKASLSFFATRPPLRAYITSTEQGYFTRAVADTITSANTLMPRRALSLQEFVQGVHDEVAKQTHGTQEPLQEQVGYDMRKVNILDDKRELAAQTGVRHVIRIHQSETVEECATLPPTARLTISASGTETLVPPPIGCEVSFLLNDKSGANAASVTLSRSPGVKQDEALKSYDWSSTEWEINVHYDGPATRISISGLKNKDGIGVDPMYERLLNDRAATVAGMLLSSPNSEYARTIALVNSTFDANWSFAKKVDYLERTNSLALVWGEPGSGDSSKVLHLHALLRSSTDTPNIVNLEVRPNNYEQAADLITSVFLLSLLGDASHRGHMETQISNLKVLTLQRLRHVPEPGADLERIRLNLEQQLRAN
jgi:hypothetical protein